MGTSVTIRPCDVCGVKTRPVISEAVISSERYGTATVRLCYRCQAGAFRAWQAVGLTIESRRPSA